MSLWQTRGDSDVKEQINKNTKEQAIAGDLPETVKKSVVNAMKSHQDLARAVLKDSQTMEEFISVIFDVVKEQKGESTNTVL